MKTKQMTTLTVTNSISLVSSERKFLLIVLAFNCFAFSPAARADGDLGGGNTTEGADALGFSLTTGGDNTGLRFQALFSNTTGSENTATGSGALAGNTKGFDNTATGILQLSNTSSCNNNTATGSAARD